jgi:glycogen operon protein
VGIGRVVSEFKYLVRTLHEAGIEVILDVVYNHTAVGNHLGPALSFRGIDNRAYYRPADDQRFYFDTTAWEHAEHAASAGSAVDHRLAALLVSEMRADGFRFDLAASLGRQFHEVDRLSAFFDLIQVRSCGEPGEAATRPPPLRGRPSPVVTSSAS